MLLIKLNILFNRKEVKMSILILRIIDRTFNLIDINNLNKNFIRFFSSNINLEII